MNDVDETEEPEITDADETDDDDALEAEFTETKAPVSHVADDGDAIKGEPVKEPSEVEDLDNFLASLPTTTDVTIIVKRKPDHGLKFRIPNLVDGHVETRIWGRESLDDIYEEIKRTHGGGRYWFQLRYGTSLGRAWQQTILDPAEPSERERTLNGDKTKAEEQQRKDNGSQVFANPPAAKGDSSIKEMIKNLREVEELRELLAPPGQTAMPYQMTADEQIKLKLFEKLADKEEFAEKLIDYGFGIFEKKTPEKKETWIDLVKYAIKSPNESMQLVSGIMQVGKNLFFGGAAAPVPAMQRPPSFQMPKPSVPSGLVQPVSPVNGLQMPDPRPDAQTAAPLPQTQPAATDRPASVIKRVEW